MDDGRYRIREFQPEDFPAEARLSNRVDPEEPRTAEELQHWEESMAAPHLIHRKFVAEERVSGAMVAGGELMQVPFNYHPRRFWASVQVDPDHRRRGIGQRLYDVVEREATERAAIGLWGSARAEDPPSVRFLQRQGFVEQRRVWVSRLELARADLSVLIDRSAALAAQGIRFSTLAAEGPDRPEVRERFYRVWDTSGLDVPVVGTHTSVPFEQFVRLEFEGPDFCPEAVFLAIHDDEYVGVTANNRSAGDPGTLWVGFTGTLRAYRGRGIASELKRRAIEYARTHGYRYMRTGNDSLNAPIWAINERLGFLRLRTWIQAEKALPGER
jgi:mycothiol synthase